MNNKMKKIVGALTLIIGGISVSQANTVSIDPAAVLVSPGDTFSISVTADLTDVVAAGGFAISWDPNIISIDTTMSAPNWTPAMNPVTTVTPSPLTNIAINANSIVADFNGCLFTCSGSVTGLLTMMDNINFKVDPNIAPGINQINLNFSPVSSTGWRDSNGAAIQPTFNPASIIISNPNPNAVPLPAAAWLMGSGLIGLLGFSRKRREVAAA